MSEAFSLSAPIATPFESWLDGLAESHQRDLGFRDIRKGIQALSRSYVERDTRTRLEVRTSSPETRSAWRRVHIETGAH